MGYDDHDTAKRAYEQVQTLQRDYIVDLNGLALVTVDAEGKNHVETPSKIVGVSAASGALWGTLLGILFLVPVVGLLVGGALGALFGQDHRGQVRERDAAVRRPGVADVAVRGGRARTRGGARRAAVLGVVDHVVMRRTALTLIVAVVGGLLIGGCGDESGESAGTRSEVDVDGRTFDSVEVHGQTLAEGSIVTITFDGGRISAFAGCNRMMSQGSWDGGVLSVSGPWR